MANILLTMAEDEGATTSTSFAVRYPVDEHDCLEFAGALVQQGHEVYFVNWKDLQGETFSRMFSFNRQSFVAPLPVQQFQLAFVYKMEGFLFDTRRFFDMVSLLERYCRVVLNHPATIRHNIDKSYLWQLEAAGVRVAATYEVSDVVAKLEAGQLMVLKPKIAERGYGAMLARGLMDVLQIADKWQEYLAQEYISEIRTGECSLVFLGHEFQHAVIKHPNPSDDHEFRCNESLGGTVQVYDPPTEEISYAKNILKVYESMGYPVHFSRVDYVRTAKGPTLIEAELLNPSIYANYAGRGKEFAKRLAEYFDAQLARAQEKVLYSMPPINVTPA